MLASNGFYSCRRNKNQLYFKNSCNKCVGNNLGKIGDEKRIALKAYSAGPYKLSTETDRILKFNTVSSVVYLQTVVCGEILF